MKSEDKSAKAEEELRWPDQGLIHPKLKNVRTIRVRLRKIGKLPPRISTRDVLD